MALWVLSSRPVPACACAPGLGVGLIYAEPGCLAQPLALLGLGAGGMDAGVYGLLVLIKRCGVFGY